jgi:hypothetical protein
MNEDSPVTYGSGNKLNNEILLMAGMTLVVVIQLSSADPISTIF